LQTLSRDRLIAVAEDIEQFQSWWAHSESLSNTLIRQGSAALRRLLVEDVAGRAWRQMGFSKSPTVQGPDLLAALERKSIPIRRIAAAASAGVRYAGLDTALMAVYRTDNTSTGVSADAEKGFAVANASAIRRVPESMPLDSDPMIDRCWFLKQYLDAPGLVRRGQVLSRREVTQHMAHEIGGVHLEKNTSRMRDLLVEAESKLLIETKNATLRSFYIEVLAIGQAVGRSDDLQKLALTIREKTDATTSCKQ